MAPVLTLAIPTYNRADILNETLRRIVNDPACDERVEIIVSDNCSTDHTAQVVAGYPSVKYYRNEENIRDANFTRLLGYGTGIYLKLVNDTVRFEAGKIEKMITVILQMDRSKNNLLFYEDCFVNRGCQIEVTDREELLKQVSFYTTWTANFGAWRDDFMALEEKDRYVSTQFLQVDWTYRLASNGKPTIVVFDHYFTIVALNNKGSYNLFDTFINKYLRLLRDCDFSCGTLWVEKYRLYRHFVLPWFFALKTEKKMSYSLEGAEAIIAKRYWYEPYFLPLIIVWVGRFFIRSVIS